MRPTTVGIAMVKDELDVIGPVITHMFDEVDALLVADNASSDGTRAVLADLARHAPIPMKVVDDPGLGYYQSVKMTALADKAVRAFRAHWVVPFDADEIWYAHADRVSIVLAAQPPEINVAYVAVFDHFATSIDLTDEPNPFLAMPWRKITPAKLGKVAFRWEPGAVIHQGNHGVTLPSQRTGLPLLELRHFPYRSAAQMIRKARNGAAAYAATTLPPSEGLHWRSYGQILEQPDGEQLLAEVWRQHFWYASPVDGGMILDPAPWRRWPRPEPVDSAAEPAPVPC